MESYFLCMENELQKLYKTCTKANYDATNNKGNNLNINSNYQHYCNYEYIKKLIK